MKREEDVAVDEADQFEHAVRRRLNAARERVALFDHAVRMVEHYTSKHGSTLAAAVTFFAFLSFFPIVALAFAAVGLFVRFIPEAQETLDSALRELLPGMIGSGSSRISLASMQDAAATAAGAGVLFLLYAGLRWLSTMREALNMMFETPAREQPRFAIGILRDLFSLLLIGVVLLISVGVTAIVAAFSEQVLEWIGLTSDLGWLLAGLSIMLGVLASTVLVLTLFAMLAEPDARIRDLWSGAVFGAVGFEILKQLSRFLLIATARQPAFQAFGIALILLVWIYYFSRVMLYAAAWTHTGPATRAARESAGVPRSAT